MSLWNQFLWVVFPYLALAVCVVGHLYRHATDLYGWTAWSSELLEKERLKWGSTLFHWGIIFTLLGHVAGLLIPVSLYDALGISKTAYHLAAVAMGGISGTVALAGLLLLTFRRLNTSRIRETSSASDLVAIGLLLVVVVSGLVNTLGYNLVAGPYDYRPTIGPWLRSLFRLAPDASLMAPIPLTFKLHVLAAFALAGVWPFTRLVHIWSLPVGYLRRVPILYRARRSRRLGGD
jgi:nitrate reductase gamma subunit